MFEGIFIFSFYTSHSHVHSGPPTIVRADSNHAILNMNQHHHQEDSKDSLIIQQQVQHQELLEQHQQQQELQAQDDEASVKACL